MFLTDWLLFLSLVLIGLVAFAVLLVVVEVIIPKATTLIDRLATLALILSALLAVTMVAVVFMS